MATTTEESRTKRDPSSDRPRSADVASDPVCGMDVNPHQTSFQSEWNGNTYYFCSRSCKTKFDKHPEKYS
jgi:Cu+-exporting ATPase